MVSREQGHAGGEAGAGQRRILVADRTRRVRGPGRTWRSRALVARSRSHEPAAERPGIGLGLRLLESMYRWTEEPRHHQRQSIGPALRLVPKGLGSKLSYAIPRTYDTIYDIIQRKVPDFIENLAAEDLLVTLKLRCMILN